MRDIFDIKARKIIGEAPLYKRDAISLLSSRFRLTKDDAKYIIKDLSKEKKITILRR